MQNTSFKTFTTETQEDPNEFREGDLLYIKSMHRHCISEVVSVKNELDVTGGRHIRAYSHYIIWSYPAASSTMLYTSLIAVGDKYINFGRISIEAFRKKYPEYFI